MARKCPISGRVCFMEGTLECKAQQQKHHWKVLILKLLGRPVYPYRINCPVKYPDRNKPN